MNYCKLNLSAIWKAKYKIYHSRPLRNCKCNRIQIKLQLMILKHLALFATDMFLVMIVVLVLSRNFKGLLKLKVDAHNVTKNYIVICLN